MSERDPLLALQEENKRLISLLEAHGIAWRLPPAPTAVVSKLEASRLAADEKVALFRRLFRGREDVYALRWESKTSSKSGYSPACANEWRPGICEKPRIKCSDCNQRRLIPISDAVIYRHLSGECTVGVYPLLEDDTCYFIAVDFDESEWREDIRAFAQSCGELNVPGSIAIYRSGNGVHAWVFFASRVATLDAWALPSSAIRVRVFVNCNLRPMTAYSPIRTLCPRAVLVI